MSFRFNYLICVVTCFGLLTSCGGSDSSGPGSGTIMITPAPSPTPTPVPTPTQSAVAYTPSALPSTLNATVGLHQANAFTALSWSIEDISPSNIQQDRVNVGYDPAKTSTTISLPGIEAGYLDAIAAESGEIFTSSVLIPAGGIKVVLLRPGAQNQFLGLVSTSVGRWEPTNLLKLQARPTFGVVAYGVPTSSSGLPTSGTARFIMFGYSVFDYLTEGIAGGEFGGEIDVDFGARTVTGKFAKNAMPGFPSGSTVSASLATTSIAPDGTFSGTIQVNGQYSGGHFNGQFTGPNANELMLNWSSSYSIGSPGFTPVQFGVFAGKR